MHTQQKKCTFLYLIKMYALLLVCFFGYAVVSVIKVCVAAWSYVFCALAQVSALFVFLGGFYEHTQRKYYF